ncbi:ribonuclease P protein component [Fulvitalea axinellae]|uniref:Ribonuclease P protein component n=1 Tax=Fulvitalea axinellae TaxID=1182444 RepID=A0AAU9CMX3_9BACT|nr:ribonuclease P protein component [Fulvitalea axinellae]
MTNVAEAGRKTFRKSERLHSKKLIKELFSKGSSFFLYPYKVVYLPVDKSRATPYNSVLFTVPRRNFKKAVDRNTLKRRIKEAYRLNKNTLAPVSEGDKVLLVALIYVGKDFLAYDRVELKLKRVLERLSNSVSKPA